VQGAGVRPRDLVVEIGAGAGVITRALAQAGADVVALERDARLVSELRRLPALRQVTIVEADVLHWSWPATEFSVVANLPFVNSGAILEHLLGDPRVALRRADVIVQWDFAVKQTAVWPSTLKSTLWRAWYDVALVGRLARTAFSPTPSVDAALLRIARHTVPLIPAAEHVLYRRFLTDAFAGSGPPGRLSARLSRIEVKRLAPVLGFDPGARPRDLDARQWAALFAFAKRD
jgi:23S rRNA (adenine-N6)-dimethyltransferase